MVHSAYDSFELLNNCPIKIDVVKSYGSKLLFGCSDGSLKIYTPESTSTDHPPPSAVRLPRSGARAVQWTVRTREKRVRVLEEAFGLDAGPRVERASSIALEIDLNALLSVCQLLSFSISSIWLPRKFPSVLAKISEGWISLDNVSSNPNYYFQIKYIRFLPPLHLSYASCWVQILEQS